MFPNQELLKLVLAMRPTFLLLALLVLTPFASAQHSTLGEGDSYAWAPNLGWLELIPHRPAYNDGVRVTDTHLSGFAWSDSTGWINFGDGSPTNGLRYSNTDGADSGVNHDGLGNLSGLAWSANLGWINFGWATASDPNRPRFDLYSGGFTGLVWSSNTGWINLGTGILKTDTMVVADSDNDGISDTWEYEMSSASLRRPSLALMTATSDSDNDGHTDLEEYEADTNPFDPNEGFRVTGLNTQPSAGEQKPSLMTTVSWVSSPRRHYKIHYSSNLTTWMDSASLILPASGTETATSVTYPATDHRFFRVESLLPLQP